MFCGARIRAYAGKDVSCFVVVVIACGYTIQVEDKSVKALCILSVVVLCGGLTACEGTTTRQNDRRNNDNSPAMDMDQKDQPADLPADTPVDLPFVRDMVVDMPADDGVEDQGQDMVSTLPCAPGFRFEPAMPQTGGIITVHFSDSKGWTYIGFDIKGPGQIKGNDAKHVPSSSPPQWYSRFTASAGGIYTITFYGEEVRKDVASCQVMIQDTGTPPPIDEPPQSNCQGKICGDDDGAGGKCDVCPMVGTCLDPPSPIGPNGPGQTWACLDSAGCQESGKCVIWCPGEPCLYEDSGGCPQGVESCLVDPRQHRTYEEACASCCENRFHNRPGSPGHGKFACWDSQYNICRYPGDCGKPYPQR